MAKIRRGWWACIWLVAALAVAVLAFAPKAALAAPVDGSLNEVYVSSKGNDETGTGSKDAPLASLAAAVKAASSEATVYVMSDLESTSCARFYNKRITIKSVDDHVFTVTRGDTFAAQSDSARSWYNPALIEVDGSTLGTVTASLRLENITLDDGGKKVGTHYVQAESASFEHTDVVQDAMIATYNGVGTITLGSGATLKNFGGMSAVRLSDGKLVMESGSKICDDIEGGVTRVKGAAADFGAAGAVWLQGGTLEMQNGSEISSIKGRAIYVDGGNVTVAGTIKNITPDKENAWQGTDGYIIHLRNKGAQAVLTESAVIDNDGITASESAITIQATCKLTAEANSVIKNVNGMVIAVRGDGSVLDFDGELAGKTGGSNAINGQTGIFKIKIGPNANIHDNTSWYGTIYAFSSPNANGDIAQIDLYGKIHDNISTDRGGALSMANNGSALNVTMYDGCEIYDNVSYQTGGGVMVSCGTFTMNGGKIYNNISGALLSGDDANGGGVYVRKGGTFIMNGGEITNNAAETIGGGVCFVATDYQGDIPRVELNGGAITGNVMKAEVMNNGSAYTTANGVSNDVAITSDGYGYAGSNGRYLTITENVSLGNEEIYFATNAKTVTATRGTELGNASSDSITALTTASTGKGWNSPIATFWAQNSKSTDYTVDGLTLAEVSGSNTLPVYALTQATGEDGEPAADAAVNAYAASVDTDGNVTFSLPASDTAGNGCAIAIVQPTANYGSVVIEGSETLARVADAATYDVEYTATYTMSESFKSMIDTMKNGVTDNNCKFTFTVELDSRLTAKTDENTYSFKSPIFNIEEVKGEGNTLKVTCKLKPDWKEHIEELGSTPMVLKGTGVLKAEDFKAGDYLTTTGKIEVSINGPAPSSLLNILIPANVAKTKMAATWNVSFDPNNGTLADGTASPVKVDNGATVSKPADPTREGYTFVGWYKDGNEYDFSTPVTSDMTLVARWTKDAVSLDVSKSKTAKWVTTGDTAKVTLSLPAENYKKTIDVVFVVDNAYGKDNKDATNKATEILNQLGESASSFEAVNVGLVVSGGYDPVLNDGDTDNSDANTKINVAGLELFDMLDDTNATKLEKLKTDIASESWKGMEGRKGSNIQAGLEAARALLKSDATTSASDKYIVLISDGGAFSWYENGAVYSKAYNDTTSTTNYHYCNPNDFAQIYGENSANYSCDFDTLMSKDKETVDAYSIAKPADSDWPATSARNQSQYTGFYEGKEIAKSLRSQAADLTQETVRKGYVTSREAALYHTAETIQAINSNNEANVIFVSLPYNPKSAALFNITESFKQWLANNDYVSLYRMNGASDSYDGTAYAGEVKNASDVFASVNNELVYLVGAGSTVKDVIGSDFNLDGLTDGLLTAGTFTLKVDDEELKGTVSEDGLSVHFGDEVELSDKQTYEYVVTYDKDADSFVWSINVPVKKSDSVQLSYQVKLVNKQTTAGTYTVDTNESAILTPVDSNGNPIKPQDFDKPELKYDVTDPKPMPTTGTIDLDPGEKVLIGRELKAGEFTFELCDENGKVIAETTNTAGTTTTEDGKTVSTGSFAFKNIKVEKEGTYTWTVRERSGSLEGVSYDDAVYKVVVVVTRVGTGYKATETWSKVGGSTVNKAEFTNTYKAPEDPTPANIDIVGKKVLNGATLTEGQFSFMLWQSVDGEMKQVATATNAADGSITFKGLEFTAAGTYEYIATENMTDAAKQSSTHTDGVITYDGNSYKVTVTVTLDEATNSLKATATTFTFTNTYTEPVKPTPDQPTTPTKPASTPKAVPTVGDDTNTFAPVALLAVAAAALVGGALIAKKRHA